MKINSDDLKNYKDYVIYKEDMGQSYGLDF